MQLYYIYTKLLYILYIASNKTRYITLLTFGKNANLTSVKCFLDSIINFTIFVIFSTHLFVLIYTLT